MTCRGYDPKTIKLPKTVKRLACTIMDKHQRGEFIRSHVRIEENNLRTGKRENK